MTALVPALLVGAGLALVAVGVLVRGRERDRNLAWILDLPFGERDVPVEAVTERSLPVVGQVTRAAGVAVRRVDGSGSVASALDTARIPLLPGEYVAATAGAASAVAVLAAVVTSSVFFGVAAALAVAYVAVVLPRTKARRRRRAVESQLPDALATIAASLEAGNTFLRSIQMYAEETAPPLADELARVLHETTLGHQTVDALDRMASRLRIRDLDWVVQAIRIQQETGGRLADVLHTLSEFMRAREEVRREVKVLTAEGRTSAAVLGAMPPLLFTTFQIINPGYADPLMRGWGLVVLAGAAASTAIGIGMIVRMVKIEV